MTDDTSTAAIIGQGFAFPMGTDRGGGIALSAGEDNIVQSIKIILMTAPGERAMRPDFGCAIWDLVFAPVNKATLGQMAFAARSALAQWEPRIEVQEVAVTPRAEEAAIVDISVTYTIRTTNDTRNLVYPFYVIPEGGES